MFSSMAHQLHILGIDPVRRSASAVRKELVDYIRQNKDMHPAICSSLDGKTSLDTYLSKMSEDGYWGDGNILSAACRYYSLQINVYSEGAEKPAIISDDGTADSSTNGTGKGMNMAFVHLLKNTEPSHYVSLVHAAAESNNLNMNTSNDCQGEAVEQSIDSAVNTSAGDKSTFHAPQPQTEQNQICARPAENCSSQLNSGDSVLNAEFTVGMQSETTDYSRLPMQKCSNRTLTFQPQWIGKFPWLFVPNTSAGVLCKVCSEAHRLGLSESGITDGRKEDAFVTYGFKNWKRALEKFNTHEKSHSHQFAKMQLANYKAAGIDTQLSSQHAKQQHSARAALLKIISSIRFLGRQGLPLRGHTHSQGNLFQLVKLRCEDNADLKVWIDKQYKDFTSWKIQNEVLQIMAHDIVRLLCREVRDAGMFAVVVDGTTDITRREQEAISVRYVNADLKANEVFLGFYNLETGTDGRSVADMVMDSLLRLNLPLSQLRGQTYDGASNMAGQYNGAQAIIRAKQPLALYVHCLMHSGNLVVQEAVEASPVVRDAVSYVNEVGVMCNNSTKLACILRRTRDSDANVVEFEHSDTEDVDPEGHLSRLPSVRASAHWGNPRPLCPTRVLCRGHALKTVIHHLEQILNALQQYYEESTGEPAVKAHALMLMIGSGKFIIGVKIALKVIEYMEALNTAVQSRQSSVSGMIQAMKIVSDEIQKLRTESMFHEIFQETNNMCHTLDLPMPELPRQRCPPARLSASKNVHKYQTAEEYYRVQYFQCIDVAYTALQKRYDQPGLVQYSVLEKLLISRFSPNAENKTENNVALLQQYPEVNVDQFLVQQAMFQQQDYKCATVDDVVNQLLSMDPAVRALFSQIECLTKLLLTVPVSNAEAERSFSSLRRLKTYLRSTMQQQRLNHIAVLSVHHGLLDGIDLVKVAQEFIDRHNSRQQIFGKF